MVRNGARWILNPSDVVQSDIFWYGAKDRWDMYHLERILSPESVILDVGANVGYYSIHLASALGPDCQVLAFEPFPGNYRLLCEHIELNGLQKQICAFPFGLSDRKRAGRMQMRSGNCGSANLNNERPDAGAVVTLTTLDEFWGEHDRSRLDFVKIDVEGHEERVIRGGEETIRKTRPLVLIELDPARLAQGASSIGAVTQALAEIGYVFFQAKKRRLIPLVLPIHCDFLNAFCFHRESHVSLLEAIGP